jgi:alcohol dehydrogenase (cytochrome c)
MVPSDVHDWDLTQVSPLIRVRHGGREREVVVTVGKDGILRPIDRTTHEALFETPVTTQFKTQKPLTTTDWVRVCPGALGGVEWNGPAYDPATGLLFTPAVDWCISLKLADSVTWVPGEMYIGGDFRLDSTSQGWLTAVEASTGKVRWRYRSERPMVGAVTTTAGGLLLAGENTGELLAFDARTGKVLYRFQTGGRIGGGVISYLAGGRQYIATTSGRPGFWFGDQGSPTVFVFALPEPQR